MEGADIVEIPCEGAPDEGTPYGEPPVIGTPMPAEGTPIAYGFCIVRYGLIPPAVVIPNPYPSQTAKIRKLKNECPSDITKLIFKITNLL
jgi:hypothetical protein